jgi:hypothetical protein
MFKEIFSFTVKDTKLVEEKTKEKRKNDAGVEEEVEVSKKVKKEVPYKIIIKDPTRRELEDADMEYSIEMSNCIKKGILTKAMLAKKYSDSGGLLSENDATRLVELYSQLAEAETEYTKASEKVNELSAQVALLRRDIVTLESSYQSLFSHTADTKAQNRIVLWYITHLTYFQEEGSEEKPAPMFEGSTFQDKVENYYKQDELEVSLFQAAQGKIASIVSYWYFSNDPKIEDFQKIVDDID